jgi:hypothetical protein
LTEDKKNKRSDETIEEKEGRKNQMKKLFLLILLVACSGCGLLMANPRPYTYPYPEPHPCVYPCKQDKDGHIIYHTDKD